MCAAHKDAAPSQMFDLFICRHVMHSLDMRCHKLPEFLKLHDCRLYHSYHRGYLFLNHKEMSSVTDSVNFGFQIHGVY